jgi:hypothetical protein
MSSGSGWRVNTPEKPSHGKEGETNHSPQKGRNSGMPVGHSGRTALSRGQRDMTPEPEYMFTARQQLGKQAPAAKKM